MRLLENIALRLAKTHFVREALQDKTDICALRERPAPRVLIGIGLMLFSYVMGWPAVGALGIIAFYAKEPLIVIIGGPLVYGLSHLVFLAGVYLAGAPYALIFLRMGIKALFKKIMGNQVNSSAADISRP